MIRGMPITGNDYCSHYRSIYTIHWLDPLPIILKIMDTVAVQQRKQLSRVFKEICFHIFGVALLIGLAITISVYDLRSSEKRIQKITTTAFGLIYFIIPASIIINLKRKALQKLDIKGLRSWIVWETLSLAVLTIFIGFGTTLILPPPFDFATGTILLMIIYWLPLFAYKTAQLFRIKKFIRQIEMTKSPLFFV